MLSNADFEVDGLAYRCLRLSAARQHTLFRLVSPLIPLLSAADVGLRLPGVTPQAMLTLLEPLRTIGDEAMKSVFDGCLAACERQDGEPVGCPSLAVLIGIVMNVVTINFTPLWTMARPHFVPVTSLPNDKGFGTLGPVAMPDGLDELYRPMLANLCAYREMHDGSLQIEDVARMNDLLTVRGENEARLRYVAESE